MQQVMLENDPLRLYDFDRVLGISEETFPDKFSLTKRVTVKNQYRTGACLACVLASICEYLFGKEMSEAWAYGQFRLDTDTDPGLYVMRALELASKIGMVPYSSFGTLVEMPEIRELTKQFPWLIEEAKKHCIGGFAGLNYADRDKRDKAIKTALTHDEIGLLAVSDKYFKEKHAIMLTGWDEEQNKYEFQNSWGKDWKDNGISFIPKSEVNAVYAIFAKPIDWPFKDVPTDSWYFDSIRNMYMSGIAKGITADTMEPDRPITRGEVFALIDRLCSKQEENDVNIYKVLNYLMNENRL